VIELVGIGGNCLGGTCLPQMVSCLQRLALASCPRNELFTVETLFNQAGSLQGGGFLGNYYGALGGLFGFEGPSVGGPLG
jgi:hypothetical protein